MAATQSSAFSAAVTFTVQSKILATLRNDLIWMDPGLSEYGTFDPQSDQLLFQDFPDLSFSGPLTPLTEGTAPTIDAISMNATVIGTSQYGRSVGTTDIAKRVGPAKTVSILSEKASRQAKETINRVMRTAIFTGGTPFYGSDDHTTRATLDNTDFITGNHVMQLRSKMTLANIPKFPGGTYKVFLNTRQVYDLKRGSAASDWIATNAYTDAGRREIHSGEIGTLHGMRIIEANDTPTFSSAVTVYAGIAVGDIKGWGCGDLQTLQTFHTPPGGDHSDPAAQVELVTWKVMFGCSPLNNGYYFRVESFATAL